MKAAIAENETLRPGIAGEKLRFKIQFADEVPDAGWEARKLRSGLKEKTVLLNRTDHAAGTIGGFENEWRQSELPETVGASETGQASADDDDFFGVSHGKASLSNQSKPPDRRGLAKSTGSSVT